MISEQHNIQIEAGLMSAVATFIISYFLDILENIEAIFLFHNLPVLSIKPSRTDKSVDD